MASADTLRKIQALEAASGQTKVTGYSDLLNHILADTSNEARTTADVAAYCRSAIGESAGIVTSRTLLNDFVTKLRDIPSPEVRIGLGVQALEVIATKVVSFEEQDTAIKFILADAHEANEDYTSSAKVLQSITLDSSQRTISDNDKAATWIRITRCYLEEDDPTDALTYLNRIKNIIFNVTDQATRLQFQLSQARISDSQRNFADASRTYYAVSQETVIDEDDRLQALAAAVRCAILAPAGPQRAQQLARLFRDERAAQIPEHGILEKIFLDRVLDASEVAAFASKLQPHQLAVTADGSTVLDKAVLEHNLLAASRLYLNIGTTQLGEMLGVDAEKAELYAAQMIEQGRLAGYIDQIDGLIYFDGPAQQGKANGTGAGSQESRLWDESIKGIAEEVERITTAIQTEYPDFYAANMVH